jgi:Flp pilus assembly protein TadB
MNRVHAGGLPGIGAALASAASRPGLGTMAGGWPFSLIAALAGVFLALLAAALLVTSSLSRNGRSRSLVDRIERYGPQHAPAPADRGGKVMGTALSWATRLLLPASTERGLAAQLDLAGTARTPAEWVLLRGCACLALALAVSVLAGNVLIGLAVGLLIGWLGMRLVISVRIGRRRAAFGEQLPDVLQLIVGSLKAGFSLPQALGTVVREDTQPAAGEFARALAESRVGVELEVALDAVANRMESDDLRWTVMAIRIQRGVGGNLAEVLGTTVGTMRERAYLQRHVRALSAEGRLSGRILIGLPLAVGGWLAVSDRNYVRPLYTTSIGFVMLSAAAVLFLLGVLWMRVVIKVEV